MDPSSLSSPPEACAVCLAHVSPGDAFTDPSGCGHKLHLSCFMQVHSSTHTACPTCRQPFQIPPAAPPLPAATANVFARQPQSESTRDATLPIPPEDKIVIREVVQTSPEEATAAPPIELEIVPEVSAVVAAASQRMHVNVSIVAPDMATPSNYRAGVDLMVIVDRSGSMTGSKMGLLRDAMSFLIGEMGDFDRMGCISFNSCARFEHGLIGMNDQGKQHALAKVRSLSANGGTDICDGMRNGVAALAARKVPNGVTTIFLLTDGIDDKNLDEKLALAKQVRENGWFLFVFAFGNDHNASHLNAIAEAANSSYVYIDNIVTVREAFGGAIGSQKAVSGQLLTLSVKSGDEGVIIHRAFSGHYTSDVSADGRLSITSFPNILTGEKRDCCLEVTIPSRVLSAEIGELEDTVLLSAELSYTPVNADGAMADVVLHQTARIARPGVIPEPLIRDISVDIQINRMNCVNAIKEATRLADARRLHDARELLLEARHAILWSVSALQPMSTAMANELSDCLKRIQSQNEWYTGGRSTTIESNNIWGTQRGVYTKPMKYDTSTPSSSDVFGTNSAKVTQTKSISSSPAVVVTEARDAPPIPQARAFSNPLPLQPLSYDAPAPEPASPEHGKKGK